MAAIGPLLLLLVVKGIVSVDAVPPPEELARLERLATEVGEPVFVVREDGVVQYGVVHGADATRLQLDLGKYVESLSPDSIRLVERDGDSSKDGAIKGAVVGALLGGLAAAATGEGTFMLRGMAVYGGIGYLLDRRNRARTLVYQNEK